MWSKFAPWSSAFVFETEKVIKRWIKKKVASQKQKQMILVLKFWIKYLLSFTTQFI